MNIMSDVSALRTEIYRYTCKIYPIFMKYHILRQTMAFLISYTMLYMLNLKYNVSTLILETWSQNADIGARKFM